MSLPISQLVSVDQFLSSYDNRRVAQLLSDTGVPIDSGSISTNVNMIQILNEASDMVRAAVQIRMKYSNDELTAMANSLSQGYLLRRLVSDLAFGLLNFRRGVPTQDVSKLCPGWITAQGMLAELRNGDMLFPIYVDELNLDEVVHQEAGLPETFSMNTSCKPGGFTSISARTNNSVFPGCCGGGIGNGCCGPSSNGNC